jgi:hypothetical protein
VLLCCCAAVLLPRLGLCLSAKCCVRVCGCVVSGSVCAVWLHTAEAEAKAKAKAEGGKSKAGAEVKAGAGAEAEAEAQAEAEREWQSYFPLTYLSTTLPSLSSPCVCVCVCVCVGTSSTESVLCVCVVCTGEGADGRVFVSASHPSGETRIIKVSGAPPHPPTLVHALCLSSPPVTVLHVCCMCGCDVWL